MVHDIHIYIYRHAAFGSSNMKRRRINAQEAPAVQFNELQNIRGMTNNARREVVAAYTAIPAQDVKGGWPQPLPKFTAILLTP